MQKCLISEVPSPLDIYTGFKKHSSTVQSLTYPTENFVETVFTAVTVLETVMSLVAHIESTVLVSYMLYRRELTLTGLRRNRGWNCERFHKDFIPWWCKQKNRFMNKASRQKSSRGNSEFYHTSGSALMTLPLI